MGHHAGHPHPLAVSHRAQVRRRQHPLCCQALPHEPGGVPVGRHPGGPQVGPCHLGGRHGRQRWGIHPCDHSGQPIGARPGERPGRPEGRPAVQVEAPERPRGGERLQDGPARPYPALQVLDGPVGATGGDGPGQVGPHTPHRADAQPDRRALLPRGGILHGGVGPRQVQVGGAHLHPVAAGVLDQGVGGVEPHGLGVQQGGAERRRVMVLDPATGVHQVGEGHRVALGEAVVGEGGQLLPDELDGVGRYAPAGGPGPEALVQGGHTLPAALGPHGLAQAVSLGGGEPGHVDGQLHQLLLEQRHPESPGQGVLTQWMQVGDRLAAVAAPYVWVHRPSLDGPGPDQGYLDHQVVEAAGPQPGQGGHLGPALDLEHPDGVGGADHVVDGLLLGQVGQVHLDTLVGGDEVDGTVEGAQHAEPQQVELDQAHRCAVLLVPLQDAAIGHACPLDGAHLGQRAVADDHAPRVDAEVPGGIAQLVGQVGDLCRDAPALLPTGRADPRPALQPPGEGVLLAGGVPEGPGHVTHRRAGPVGDDVGHLGGVAAPVAPVDVLDDLFAAPALDVDVDVGRTVPLRGEEPFEQQAQAHGVGVGYAEGVADGGVGRRPPTLAEDSGSPTELDQVPDHEEVAVESELPDDRQLVVDPGPRPGHPLGPPGPVPVGGPLLGQTTQVRHLVQPVGARIGRQIGGDQIQVEGAAPTQVGGRLDHPGEAGEPAGLLDTRAEVGASGSGQPAIQLVEGAA